MTYSQHIEVQDFIRFQKYNFIFTYSFVYIPKTEIRPKCTTWDLRNLYPNLKPEVFKT